jgi:hypothetical protein
MFGLLGCPKFSITFFICPLLNIICSYYLFPKILFPAKLEFIIFICPFIAIISERIKIEFKFMSYFSSS